MIAIACSKSGSGYKTKIADRFCDQNRLSIFIKKSRSDFTLRLYSRSKNGFSIAIRFADENRGSIFVKESGSDCEMKIGSVFFSKRFSTGIVIAIIISKPESDCIKCSFEIIPVCLNSSGALTCSHSSGIRQLWIGLDGLPGSVCKGGDRFLPGFIQEQKKRKLPYPRDLVSWCSSCGIFSQVGE